MKTYIEIKKQYTKNAEEIKKLKEQIDALRRVPLEKRIARAKACQAAGLPIKDEEEQNIIKAAEKMELLQIENKILYDNARRAYVEEVKPILRDVLHKYAGKPYGEKTKAKINDEMKARANCYIWLSYNYCCSEAHFSPAEDYFFRTRDLELRFYDNNNNTAKILQDNKINPAALDYMQISYCSEYEEQPRKKAAKIRREFQKLKEQERKFDKLCSDFSELLPSQIEYISSSNFRNYLF